ncbi:MAG: hypothetical protein Q8P06_02125 [Candidatus Azambacteria bacterium]|nr:hypothetical protein [Candidatus Azambacteria bacterium]
MPEYPSNPVDAMEKILVESGCKLETRISPYASGRSGDVYESRVVSKLIGKKYALNLLPVVKSDSNFIKGVVDYD